MYKILDIIFVFYRQCIAIGVPRSQLSCDGVEAKANSLYYRYCINSKFVEF